jgi:hypothetical protein
VEVNGPNHENYRSNHSKRQCVREMIVQRQFHSIPASFEIKNKISIFGVSILIDVAKLPPKSQRPGGLDKWWEDPERDTSIEQCQKKQGGRYFTRRVILGLHELHVRFHRRQDHVNDSNANDSL